MKKILKEKRIEILLAIEELHSKCNCLNNEQFESCDNCKKIQYLGNQLIGLANNVNSKVISPKKRKKNVKLEITEKEYREYKAKKKSDKEIAKIHNVDIATLNNWKKANKVFVKKTKTESVS